MTHRFNWCWRSGSWPLDMLSGQCYGKCTDALFVHRRFNRCNGVFFTWLSISHPIAPMPLRRFVRCQTVRSMTKYQFNRCYYFCIHLFNSSRRSFGHLKNILYFFTMVWVSRRWIGHISMAKWTYWILSIRLKNPTNMISEICWSHWLCCHTITKITNNSLMGSCSLQGRCKLTLYFKTPAHHVQGSKSSEHFCVRQIYLLRSLDPRTASL